MARSTEGKTILPDLVLETLHKHFGLDALRPGQAEAIQSLLHQRHTLVVMPTGSGKSLIYQLTAYLIEGITLVISPLIALMKDQVDGLEQRKIAATYLNSSLPRVELDRRLGKLAQGQCRLVYVAPERFRSDAFMRAMRGQKIGLLAVDEAHCISEWGHDFRPDYLHIRQVRSTFGDPLTAALTATATVKVQEDILSQLGLGSQVTRIVTGFNRPNLRLEVQHFQHASEKLPALRRLLPAKNSGAVIIYTGTQRDSEEVANYARSALKIPAEHYHAGLAAEERSRIQERFMRGRVNLVAATNAFGMGIDRADVRQVIHYSMPGSLEAYYQEAGRAGRDGLDARAILLYSPKDHGLQEFFIRQNQFSAADFQKINLVLPAGQSTVDVNALNEATGIDAVKLRNGLGMLERAGMLERIGIEFRDGEALVRVNKKAWTEEQINQLLLHNRMHVSNRKIQLAQIENYAQARTCRRRMILDYFGDRAATDAANCCDNCRPALQQRPLAHKSPRDEPATLEENERICLNCIRNMKYKVKAERIVEILQGKNTQVIRNFHYDRNPEFGRLAGLSVGEIEKIIQKITRKEYIELVGEVEPMVSLTPYGAAALKSNDNSR